MNLPYYYTETPVSNDQSNKLLFQYVNSKLKSMDNSFHTAGSPSLLNEYITSTVHRFEGKNVKPPKQTLENCLQFPSYREYQSKFVKNEEDFAMPGQVTNCFQGYLNKTVNKKENNREEEYKSNMIMNRLKLNEFLYSSQQNSPLKGTDYSNIKEYKFSQTVNYQDSDFQAIDRRVYNLERTEKKKRGAHTPNTRITDDFLKEFPLDELKRGVATSHKKNKRIFDMANVFSLSEKLENNPHFKKNYSERLRNIIKKARERHKTIFLPDLKNFLNEYKILDKNGEDKTESFLKRVLLDDTAILFENFEVKVGIKTVLNEKVLENSDNKAGLLIYLYYCNKNKGDLRSCSLKFAGSKSTPSLKFFTFLSP